MIADGDELAFSACVQRFTPRLFPYIKSIINSDLWVEDILQDMFTRLWNNRHKLKEVENPAAYIIRMAGRLALDLIKHKSVEVKAQYIIARQIQEQSTHATGDTYDRNYLEKLKRKALERLTPQQQLVYAFRYDHGLSYEEISKRLDISKNTVRNHLVAGISIMKQYLKGKEYIIAILYVIILFSFLKFS